MLTTDDLKLADFEAWLRGQPEGTTFVAVNACKCPLAAWLGTMYPGVQVRHNRISYPTFRDGYAHVETPKWAGRFMDIFDAGRITIAQTTRPLSAAITALEQVKAELGNTAASNTSQPL